MVLLLEEKWELLHFIGLDRDFYLSVGDWMIFTDYDGADGVKVVAFGSLGTQYDMYVNPSYGKLTTRLWGHFE